MRIFSKIFRKLFGKRTRKTTKPIGDIKAIDTLKNMHQQAVRLEQIEVDTPQMMEVKEYIDDLPRRIAFIAKKIADAHAIPVDSSKRLFGMDGTYDVKHTYSAYKDSAGLMHRGRPAISIDSSNDDDDEKKKMLVVEVHGSAFNSDKPNTILHYCDTFDDAKIVANICNAHSDLLLESSFDRAIVIHSKKFDPHFIYE